MPLPWKKMKSAKISKWVNDHLNKSQKRRDGSSLVVETGFPTSLIDLIIKNHDKLKSQQPKRKSQNSSISDVDYSPTAGPPSPFLSAPPPSIAGSPRPPPSVSGSPRPLPLIVGSPRPAPSIAGSPRPPPSPSSSIAGSPSSTYTPLRCPSPSPLHNLATSPLLSPSGRVSEIPLKSSGVEKVADVYRVLLGILKMFFVVVLTLGTQRLTVGITLSAFLLLFLEYVGKNASRFSKPFSEAKGALSSTVQAVETKHEIQPVNELKEESEPCLEYQEFESREKEGLMSDVTECKRKSRKARIKLKMKKLLKFKKSFRKENSLQMKDESVEEQVDQCENEAEAETVTELSSVSGGKCGEEEGGAIARLADAKTEEKVLEHGGLNRKQLVVCLIVLIGLFGGRVFAFVLTLLWFLLLKLGQYYKDYS